MITTAGHFDPIGCAIHEIVKGCCSKLISAINKVAFEMYRVGLVSFDIGGLKFSASH